MREMQIQKLTEVMNLGSKSLRESSHLQTAPKAKTHSKDNTVKTRNLDTYDQQTYLYILSENAQVVGIYRSMEEKKVQTVKGRYLLIASGAK